MEYETDIKGNHLVREEELNIIYDGPSFDGRMEISHLSNQLKSTELVIREIVSELYKQKRLKNPKDVKIYLQLKKGSFQEIITVIFNNPIIANIIGGCIVAIFTYYLTKKKEKPECHIKTENLVNNYIFVKNLNQIIIPLGEKDKVSIISSNPSIRTTISHNEKNVFNSELRELKEKVAIEIFEEEFFGYLSIVDIDKEKYGFTLERTNQHIPVFFDIKPTLDEIRKILGYRIKIDARATYEEKELVKLDVQSYELKRRKNLKDFYKNGKSK